MQFEPTSDQSLLRDSVRRFVEKDYRGQDPASGPAGAPGFSDAHWARFAELGWLMAALPEEAGGLGQGPFASALIAEELGRGLVREPYVAVAVGAAQLLLALGPEAGALVEAVGAGAARPVIAHGEPGSQGDPDWTETAATRDGTAFRLTGCKTAVLGGPVATRLLVTARLGDALALFAVDPAAEGLRRQDYRTIDGRGASNLHMDGLVLPPEALLAEGRRATDALGGALAQTTVARCAETVGVMAAAFDMTRDYLKTRRQFGSALADFQALRHRLADMYMELELARSALLRGIDALSASDATERDRHVAATRVRVSRAGQFVTAQAIQLHGGIGVTEEYAVGHHFKRMVANDLLLGPIARHVEQVAESGRRTP